MRIVMTTWGSLGDLHPYLAVGIGLQRRGHFVRIVTAEHYREKVEGEGLDFFPSRPDLRHMLDDPRVWKLAYDERTGTEYIIRELLLPYLTEMYEDLDRACEGADLLVSHPIAYAGPIVGEKRRMPWASIALAPISLFSASDPPVFSPAPWLHKLRHFGSAPHLALYAFIRMYTRSWMKPVAQLRTKVGLPAERRHPMLEGTLSPYGTAALFSPIFSPPQEDWPARTHVCGFVFYDKDGQGAGLDDGLRAFLDAGEPPVVFTLGSSAVFDAGSFYEESVRAVNELGCRAVLLVGTDPRYQPNIPADSSVFVAGYAPYSELLPRASAVVHQGGIGTMAQVLRAGKPMLVVPYGHDQPDNAMRAVRLKVAETIGRSKYSSARAATALRKLTANGSYSDAAREVASHIRQEDGVSSACLALERIAST